MNRLLENLFNIYLLAQMKKLEKMCLFFFQKKILGEEFCKSNELHVLLHLYVRLQYTLLYGKG